MTRSCMLTVLSALLALTLSADTLELKNGERIDGTFKQATSAGAVIEVAGQPITVPLEKIQAIYFGAVPARTGEGARLPSQEALDALRALRSVTGSGIALREYSTRVLDANVTVDRYLAKPGSDSTELQGAIRVAMVEYELASRAWRANVEVLAGDLWKLMGDTMQDPEVAKCPTVRAVTAAVDNPPPQPTPTRLPRSVKIPPATNSTPRDRAASLGIGLANINRDNLAPGIWACASEQLAEAERLMARR